jgi:predicted N-acetyltransferase YhbS
MEDIKKGRWRHYKGNDYEVLDMARHSETLEPMVVYRALYGEGGVWVRPAAMWHETVHVTGASTARFTYTGDMALSLRPETPDDYRITENLTREAFWNLMRPGCDEHFVLHAMRGDSAFIPELDIVAELDGRIVGHIVYTRSAVTDRDGVCHETITFGPVTVLPEYQKRGIGARLIFHTLDMARELGYGAVIILGHPAYYPRLGFRRAAEFGLTLENGEAFDAFMALELKPGSLSSLGGGVYRYAQVFNTDPAAVDLFDLNFPPKEKRAAGANDI